jgi:hypothetical protein
MPSNWLRMLPKLALASCLVGLSALAQTSVYPLRQIQIVVPFPAGGSADFFARAVANKLSAVTGQTTVIENKAGASGMIGARAVINSPPDGYTWLVSSVTSVTIPPAMSYPPAFDALKDLAPITGIGMVPAVLVVKPSLGRQELPRTDQSCQSQSRKGEPRLVRDGDNLASYVRIADARDGNRNHSRPVSRRSSGSKHLLGGHGGHHVFGCSLLSGAHQSRQAYPSRGGNSAAGSLITRRSDHRGTWISGNNRLEHI